MFLAYEGREAMYGGAAGGGKSDALLMAALQYVESPNYSALLLRRTYADLALPGAIMDRAMTWLMGSKAHWDRTNATWRFPSGATISFGYLDNENDKYRYQGAEFQFVGFDELTQFTESQYGYLFSRLRKLAGSPIPIRMRAASNPGGRGHEWVKSRFIDYHGTEERIFIPAKVQDNPHLDQDEYLKSLSRLDPVTRAQLLEGDWQVFDEGRIKREWLRYYRTLPGAYWLGEEEVPKERCWRFITVDPAASVKEHAKADPDYTVISVWGVTPRYHLLWLDCVRIRVEVPDIVPQVRQLYDRYKVKFCAIEAGGTQKGVYQLAKRTPMVVRQLLPGREDKLVRATPAINLLHSGRVWLPQEAGWLEPVELELLRFTGDPKQDGHDDTVDTLAYAAHLIGEHGGQGRQWKPTLGHTGVGIP